MQHKDDETGDDYYEHVDTGETTWELPEGAVLVKGPDTGETNADLNRIQREVKRGGEGTVKVKGERGTYLEIYDEETGRTAYYNTKTGLAQFDRPKGWVRLMGERFGNRRKSSLAKR